MLTISDSYKHKLKHINLENASTFSKSTKIENTWVVLTHMKNKKILCAK